MLHIVIVEMHWMTNRKSFAPVMDDKGTLVQEFRGWCKILRNFPRIYRSRYLVLTTGMHPTISKQKLDGPSIVESIHRLTRVAKFQISELHIVFSQDCIWKLRFECKAFRDQWMQRLSDTISFLKWLYQHDIDTKSIRLLGDSKSMYTVKSLNGQTQWVLKLLPTGTPGLAQIASDEIRHHQKVLCSKVVNIVDTFRQSSHAILLLEYCHGGSLQSFLDNHPNVVISEDRIKWILRYLLCCIHELHNHDIVHVHLNASNIFIRNLNDFKKWVKYPNTFLMSDILCVGDFSASKCLTDASYYRKQRSNINFVAPEFIEPLCDYSYQVDIYSLGLLVAQLRTHGQDSKSDISDTSTWNSSEERQNATTIMHDFDDDCHPSEYDLHEVQSSEFVSFDQFLEIREEKFVKPTSCDPTWNETKALDEKQNKESSHHIYDLIHRMQIPVPMLRMSIMDILDHPFLEELHEV